MSPLAHLGSRITGQFPVRGLVAMVGLFTIVFFMGCSGNSFEFMADDDSPEATIEAAMIALDDEDFDKAVSILEDLDPEDENVRRYLSNAYSGQAGLDTFSLIQTIDDMSGVDDDVSIDLVGRILDDDGEGTYTQAEIDDKIEKFDKAIETMLDMNQGTTRSVVMARALTFSVTELNHRLEQKEIENDILVQLGLLGLNHAVLNIAKLVAKDLEQYGIVEITLTEAWIKSQYAGSRSFRIILTEEEERILDDISLDLNLLSSAIGAIIAVTGEDHNDLEEAFAEFFNKIDTNEDLAVTAREVEAYVNAL